MNISLTNKEKISKYIKQYCIEYTPKGEFFFGKLSGARYASQFYLSRLLYNIDMLEVIGEEFVNIIEEHIGHWDFQITGREWSSVPLLTFLPIYMKNQHFRNINSFMIKRKRKTYGIHNYVEGRVNDLPVLIVDDLCNSTDSFRHCEQVVKSMNMTTLPFIFAVMNKYSYASSGEDEPEFYDRYLGRKYKALSILIRDDLK